MENRLVYDMIGDASDLSAAHAIAIAQGHCFRDVNKCTAFRAMQVSPELNGISVRFTAADIDPDIGPVILRAA